jgi:prepilin-type N-terminal cleavage/methylation domain-containing protein
MRYRKERDDDGFTLFELMAVVLILGILVAIAVASFSLTNERAKRVVCQENQRTLNTAVLVYEQKEGHTPAAISDLAPHVAKPNFDKCPSGPSYSYDATTALVTCPIHPPQ